MLPDGIMGRSQNLKKHVAQKQPPMQLGPVKKWPNVAKIDVQKPCTAKWYKEFLLLARITVTEKNKAFTPIQIKWETARYSKSINNKKDSEFLLNTHPWRYSMNENTPCSTRLAARLIAVREENTNFRENKTDMRHATKHSKPRRRFAARLITVRPKNTGRLPCDYK